ncbi:MAG: sugar transferase [Cytophagaceae bacterium]|nr:sugar transferase [Cytophagaceae bacterium]|tara:strand:+ start:33874 stop:35262 length:1389 start_codon:yes stop_codon:yes gene_type:complete
MSWLPNIHFDISERRVLLRIFDLVVIYISLAFFSHILEFNYFVVSSARWTWIIVLFIYFSIFGNIFELYDLRIASSYTSTLRKIILTVSATVLFYLLTPFFTPVLPENRFQILAFYVLIVVGLVLWRYAYITFITAARFYKRILVVGDSYDIDYIASNLQSADPNYKVLGYINTDGGGQPLGTKGIRPIAIDNLSKAVKRMGISEIVVSSSARGVDAKLYNKLIQLLERGYPIREFTQVYEELTYRVPVQHVERDFYKYFPFSRNNQNRFYLFFHRLFNVLFSTLAILVTGCFVPFILLGNMMANRGKLFYTQERIGRNGVPFTIYKFRTMVADAEKHGAQYSQKNDFRITPFGKFLRYSRLDELPQCVNILKGDMSLIGPRPERPVFARELAKKIPFYEVRHMVRPGLTGWAQVKGRYANNEDDTLEKLQYDLYYIKHRNIFLDIDIILKTISTVIYYRGQ